MRKILLHLSLLTLFIQGCSFSSNQYTDFFGSRSLKKFDDLTENIWTFKYLGKDYKLLAVSVTPEKSIFADREGRYVLFDGWTIREKGGF